jgi:hypothetical protein
MRKQGKDVGRMPTRARGIAIYDRLVQACATTVRGSGPFPALLDQPAVGLHLVQKYRPTEREYNKEGIVVESENGDFVRCNLNDPWTHFTGKQLLG